MCRSGVWVEALGQANACLTWCTSRFQADWKRNFGQLLRQHVISDAIGYKLEDIFGLEPVSLLSIQCILNRMFFSDVSLFCQHVASCLTAKECRVISAQRLGCTKSGVTAMIRC